MLVAYLSIHVLGSCEYVRKMLGLYAARRDEVSVGVGSLEVKAVKRRWFDPSPPPIFWIFSSGILIVPILGFGQIRSICAER